MHIVYNYRDPAIVFTPLPGAIMDDEYQYPPPDLFILPGFPVRQSSMLRHGQLPPLRYAVGAPSPLSSTFLNAATNGHPVHAPEPLTSRPVSTLDTGESRLLDGSMDDLELDLDEVIIMPSRKDP